MALGYGLQMATIMQQSNRMDISTRHELEAKVELSTRIQASTFLRADCATQVQILQAMIASFRIVVETDVEEENVAEIAEAAEEDYDSDVVFIDDAEIRDAGRTARRRYRLMQFCVATRSELSRRHRGDGRAFRPVIRCWDIVLMDLIRRHTRFLKPFASSLRSTSLWRSGCRVKEMRFLKVRQRLEEITKQ